MLLFTTLTLMLMLFGYIIGIALSVNPLSLMLVGLVFATIINFASYAFSDRFVLWSTHTKLINEIDNPQLYSIVRNVAMKANIPMPRVGIVESPQPAGDRHSHRLRQQWRDGRGIRSRRTHHDHSQHRLSWDLSPNLEWWELNPN